MVDDEDHGGWIGRAGWTDGTQQEVEMEAEGRIVRN